MSEHPVTPEERFPEVNATLKPCPMCGQEAALGTNVVNRQVDDKGTYKSMTGYSVNCIWCGVNNRSIAEGYATPELAAERWNRRTPPSETPDTGKLLKDMRYELSRLMAGAPVDNHRLVRLVERVNEHPLCRLPEVSNG